MKRIRWPLYTAWALAIAAAAVISLHYRGEHTEFTGIAETRENIISSEQPVLVRKIHVLAGQQVAAGQLLVDLDNPGLRRTISELSREIEKLREDRSARAAELTMQIDRLQARYDFNRRLAAGLKSIDGSNPAAAPADTCSPLKVEIDGLRKARAVAADPRRIDLLATELALREKEQRELRITARAAGIVSDVKYCEGETVQPYQPILTIHRTAPSFIKGFVHEYIHSSISIGQQIAVFSMADPARTVTGTVTGLGARIVQYPMRLQRMLNVCVYGREVRVKIPAGNPLLVGEKVILKTLPGAIRPAGAEVLAADSGAFPAAASTSRETASDITIAPFLDTSTPIEASAIVYLPDLQQYLVASDDTTGNRPVLYLMDGTGLVREELLVQGLRAINDMEAITADAHGHLYVCCSQSCSKKGNRPSSRTLLVRVTRQGTTLHLDGKISLYALISDAATGSAARDWAWLAGPDGTFPALDVEGTFYREGDLYVGLKQPFRNSRTAILKISRIDDILDSGRTNGNCVSLWRELDLKDPASGRRTKLSDMYLHQERLYLLSCDERVPGTAQGHLWTYDLSSDRPCHVRSFLNVQTEGVALNFDTGRLAIVCEHEARALSRFITLPCP